MAVNLCPGSPSYILCASPRISFSHDLDHHPSSDHVSRSDHDLLLPRLSPDDSDFEFRLPPLETSTADELFSGGMILPADIKERKPNPPLSETSTQVQKDTEEEDIIITSTRAKLIREEKGNNNSKSFWRFMRSSSLNYDSKKASIWSSLPLLARSNSTGSSPNTNTKQSSHGGSSSYRKSVKPLSSSSSSNSNAGFPQKPPLGKSYSVVPPPYIAKGTSDLLGLGSLFRHGNERKGKKR